MSQTIRGRLLFFSLLFSLLPVIIVGVLVFYQARQSLHEQVGTTVLQIAEVIAADIQRFLDDHAGDIQIIAISPILTSDEVPIEEKLAYLQRIQDAYGIYDLALCDGYTRDESIVATDGASGNHSRDIWFLQAMKQDTFVSDVYYLPTVQGIVLSYATLIKDENDEVIGVLAAHIDAQTLFDTVSSVRVGETGQVFLVNHEGRIVAKDERADIFNDVNDLLPVQAGLRGEKGTMTDVGEASNGASLYG